MLFYLALMAFLTVLPCLTVTRLSFTELSYTWLCNQLWIPIFCMRLS